MHEKQKQTKKKIIKNIKKHSLHASVHTHTRTRTRTQAHLHFSFVNYLCCH